MGSSREEASQTHLICESKFILQDAIGNFPVTEFKDHAELELREPGDTKSELFSDLKPKYPRFGAVLRPTGG